MEYSNKDFNSCNSKMIQVKECKTYYPSTEINCADKLCEPVYKKLKYSHNNINYYQENKNIFNSDHSIVYIKEVLHPNLPKYVTNDSSQALGLNFERPVENDLNFNSLTSIIESAYSGFQNAHFIVNQQLFAPLPRIQVPYSDILKYFGISNDPKPGAGTCNESLKSIFLESDQETEKIKSKFVFNSNGELDTEWSDALLTYNPLRDIWPCSLSPLEFSMVPSVGIHDSRNWDIIDNLSFANAKKINYLSCEASIDNRKSSIVNSASLTNSQARFAPDTRLQNKQCNDNLINEPAIQHRPSDMIDVGTITHSNKTNNVPLCLKNSLSRKNNERQENCKDGELVKKNEIGHLNETVQYVAKFKQMGPDTTISEYVMSQNTSCLEKLMSNLPSNNMQPALEKSKDLNNEAEPGKTSDSIVPVSSASSCSSEIIRKSNNEPHSISSIRDSVANKTWYRNILPRSQNNYDGSEKKRQILPKNQRLWPDGSKNLTEYIKNRNMVKIGKKTDREATRAQVCTSTPEQSSKSKVLSHYLRTSHMLNPHSMMSMSLELTNNCSMTNSEQDKSIWYPSLSTSQNQNPHYIDLMSKSDVNNCPKPTSEQPKTNVHSYLRTSQIQNPCCRDSVNVSLANNCPKLTPEHQKPCVHSYLNTSQNQNPCSNDSMNVKIANICSKLNHEQDKSTFQARSIISQNMNPHSIDSMKVSVAYDFTNRIPEQGNSSGLSYNFHTLQSSNPHSIDAMDVSVAHDIPNPIPVQDKLALQASSIASLNLIPHSIDSASMSAVNNCSNSTSELDKTTMHSYLPSLQNLNLSSTDPKNVILSENCAITISEQEKSISQPSSTTSQNSNPHSLTVAIVSIANNETLYKKILPKTQNYDQQNENLTENNNNKASRRKLLPKTQNYARHNKNLTENDKSSELDKIGKAIEHEPMKVNMSIPEQSDKSKVLSCNLRTSQRLNPQTIKSTSLDFAYNCSMTNFEQDKSRRYPSISTSQNQNPHLTCKRDVNNCYKPTSKQPKADVHSNLRTSQIQNTYCMDAVNVSIANNCSKTILDQDKLKLQSSSCASQNLNSHSIASTSIISVASYCVSKPIPDKENLFLHSDLHTLQKLNLPSIDSTIASVFTKYAKPISEQDKSLSRSCFTTSQNMDPHSIDSTSVSAGNNLCHVAQAINPTEANDIKSYLENDNFDTTLPVIENTFSLSGAENWAKECTISSMIANENDSCTLIGPLVNETTNMPFFLQVPTSSVNEVLASLKINPSNINLIKS